MDIYKTIFRVILAYGSKSWVLTRSQKSKIQANEMKYLRIVTGITRLNRIRKTQIRAELEIIYILDFIEQR